MPTWKLDTGNDGCDETLYGDRDDVIYDVCVYHDIDNLPSGWTLTELTDPRIQAIAEAIDSAKSKGIQTVLAFDDGWAGFGHCAYHRGDELHPGFIGTAWPDGVFRTPEQVRQNP